MKKKLSSVRLNFSCSLMISTALFLALPAVINYSQEKSQVPEAKRSVTGKVESYSDFDSKLIDKRNIDVWLPPSYGKERDKKYPVIYMHDGQNLFDPSLSYSKVDWGIDETMTRLIESNEVREAIVVGVWNTQKRRQEYMPQKALEMYEKNGGDSSAIRQYGPACSDNYLKFLVKELKPFIDSKYRTLTGKENTFVMGSSMGGMISAYAICEYPEVFGAAGCVSTHWPAGNGIMVDYMARSLPDPKDHRIYFDYGTETLDSLYEPFQKRMDEVMKKAGYKDNKNWMTRKFQGEEHSERSWRKRVDIPLKFLLKKW